jgi:hypothetical protein
MSENEAGASTQSELWVLTRTIDSSHPDWDEALVIVGTSESLRSQFDLSDGVPQGWRLYKGEQARLFLNWSVKEELCWARDQQTRRNAGDPN